MIQAKYFQKLKCEQCFTWEDLGEECGICKGSGIIKGADITETIKPIFDYIEERNALLIKEKDEAFEEIKKLREHNSQTNEGVALTGLKYINRAKRKNAINNRKVKLHELNLIKQIIEENVIIVIESY